jgi:integration host factor subunit beta
VLRSKLIDRMTIARPLLRRTDLELLVQTVFAEIAAALARGDRVELRGIGTFSVRARRARPGRNPKSGSAVLVPDKRVPHFRTSKRMNERLNVATAD